VIDDFVTGVEQGAESEVDGLGDAHGDEDLGEGFVGDAEVFADIIGDGAAEAGEAEIRGVAGAAALEGEDGGFADVPGRGEVRLADAERDDIVHGLDDFEEVADARAGDVADVVGDGDAHGETARRSEVGSNKWKVPFSL
jgi:hypothetical protein